MSSTTKIKILTVLFGVLQRGPSHAKSGKVRAVPMASDVAGALARFGQRVRCTSDDDLVFPGAREPSCMRRRCTAASSPRRRGRAQGGCASTTCATRSARRWQCYSHFTPRHEDAELVAEAFAINAAGRTVCARSTV